jgi:hypothetical protein
VIDQQQQIDKRHHQPRQPPPPPPLRPVWRDVYEAIDDYRLLVVTTVVLAGAIVFCGVATWINQHRPVEPPVQLGGTMTCWRTDLTRQERVTLGCDPVITPGHP